MRFLLPWGLLMATETGLRERKKQQTRQLLADTARRLFAERGFENVSVADIARAAVRILCVRVHLDS